jgi:hypothetical protein
MVWPLLSSLMSKFVFIWPSSEIFPLYWEWTGKMNSYGYFQQYYSFCLFILSKEEKSQVSWCQIWNDFLGMANDLLLLLFSAIILILSNYLIDTILYIYMYVICIYIYSDVTEMSKNLASESKKYKWGAKKLSLMVSYFVILFFNLFKYLLIVSSIDCYIQNCINNIYMYIYICIHIYIYVHIYICIHIYIYIYIRRHFTSSGCRW